jgi:hypothetical protein
MIAVVVVLALLVLLVATESDSSVAPDRSRNPPGPEPTNPRRRSG